jgi:hypothetical protein
VEPLADLLVPGKRPVLPLVLLHPILRAVDSGRCWNRRFLVDDIGTELPTRRPRWHGVGSLLHIHVLQGKAANGARRRILRRLILSRLILRVLARKR